jgi:hypothetical protein
MFPEFMSSTSHNRAGQVEGTCRTIGSVSIYRKGPSFSSRDMGLEGGFQSLDELVLDQVSESTKNLCTLQPSSSMENET